MQVKLISGRLSPYYYTCTSDTPWNYGFRLKDMTEELMLENFKVQVSEDKGVYPWNLENVPVSIKAKAVVIKPKMVSIINFVTSDAMQFSSL